MKIPRPSGGSRQSNGVGKIFIKYDGPESAQKALAALAGRKFQDRTVVTTYFSEVSLPLSTWNDRFSNVYHRKVSRSMPGKRWLKSESSAEKHTFIIFFTLPVSDTILWGSC